MTTAVVTGPTAGLGLGFAHALAERGHDLCLVARDVTRLEHVAGELRATYGISTEVLSADLSDRDRLAAVEVRCADPDRPIEVLVNNAGFAIGQRFVGGDVTRQQALLDILVTTPMRLCHAVLPGMVERGSGTILNISSVSGWLTRGTYSAAKAWVTTFTEGLNSSLQGTGVTATCVAPGFVHTEFHERANLDMDWVPDWMWLDVEQVVATALKDADKGRAVSVAGRQYRALSLAARYAPRPIIRRLG